MSKIYRERVFKGLKVNCSKNCSAKLDILEALYVKIFKSSLGFANPIGFHCRFRLTDKLTMRELSARLGVYFQRKSGYIPLRVSVCERDSDGGQHYHCAIVLEGKKDRKFCLNYFFAELKKALLVSDYKVITADWCPYGANLKDRSHREWYFYWLSYIAKTNTKVTEKQSWSTDKATRKDIKAWSGQSKPVLHDTIEICAASDLGGVLRAG